MAISFEPPFQIGLMVAKISKKGLPVSFVGSSMSPAFTLFYVTEIFHDSKFSF